MDRRPIRISRYDEKALRLSGEVYALVLGSATESLNGYKPWNRESGDAWQGAVESTFRGRVPPSGHRGETIGARPVSKDNTPRVAEANPVMRIIMRVHNGEMLIAYCLDELANDQRYVLEEHTKECAACRDFVDFTRKFFADLKSARTAFQVPLGESCPDASALVDLYHGELDPPAAEQVRLHLLKCRDCREEFMLLERSRPRVVDVPLRAANGVVCCICPPELAECEAPEPIVELHGTDRVALFPYWVAQILTDQNGNKNTVALRIEDYTPVVRHLEQDRSAATRIRVAVECQNPDGWELRLFDAANELAAMPLVTPETVAGLVPCGTYRLEIVHDGDTLGEWTFSIELFAVDEALEEAGRSIEDQDYARAEALLVHVRSHLPNDGEEPGAGSRLLVGEKKWQRILEKLEELERAVAASSAH